ncbi:prephenate dehydrogenase [Halovenus marina]|uniref:prephenate dehydrogenase n=1 Tax=Halovenus marina TaxID=3396621 RepID=UPI003F54EED3
MNALVVGSGAMGRWFGEVLVDLDSSISFLDADTVVAREAADAVGGNAVETSVDETFDLVVIAVPIPTAPTAIETYADSARQAIVDLTGTMTDPVEAMRAHAADLERASLHPLFAPENEPGNIPVVVDSAGPLTDRVCDQLVARDNTVFETDAATHDEAMETVQARTHAAVLAFALAAENVPDRYHTPISAELTALADQVTDGDARVYADIQAAFDGAESVADAARQIAETDEEGFKRLYERAGDR